MIDCFAGAENMLQNTGRAQELKKILRAIGDLPEDIYCPSDDSYLMLEALAGLQLQGKNVLDVGTGSGILALFCALHGAQVTATDVDPSALDRTRKVAEALGVSLETILSDVFSEVNGQFDLILFNPPYLPSSTIADRAVDGGTHGTMLSRRFLEELASYLKPDGTALLLVSSLNEPATLIEPYEKLRFTVLAKRSLFFEELQVLRIRFRENLSR